jgi:hypothetical protein
MRKAGSADLVWSRKPRPPVLRGRWAMRRARAGSGDVVLVTCWRRRELAACRMVVRGEDQEVITGVEVRSVWWRTSAAKR